MDNIEFLFIGWCCETDRDGKKHDKVWTAFKAGSKYYAGWGKRGKRLSFKDHGTTKYKLDAMIRNKQKDYKAVDEFQLFVLFPNFEEEVGQTLTYAVLANKVK